MREAEYNIRRTKTLWREARELVRAGAERMLASHDAMGVLELLEGRETRAATQE